MPVRPLLKVPNCVILGALKGVPSVYCILYTYHRLLGGVGIAVRAAAKPLSMWLHDAVALRHGTRMKVSMY